MPLTIPPSTYATQISFTSALGLNSTNVNNAIDEAYFYAVKLAGTETITGIKTFSAVTTFSNNTASTSTTTGALVVTGGVGISGTVYLPTLRVNGGVNASNNTTGSLVVTGGIGVSGTSFINTLRVPNNTASTSTTTGALTVSGGVGIAGNTYIGGNLAADNLPKLFAFRSTNTASINQGVTTALIFDSEEKDNQNIHNTSTGIITIPTGYAGSYALKIYLNCIFTANGTTNNSLVAAIYKNGVSYRDILGAIAPPGTSVQIRAEGGIDLYDLAVGDTLEIKVAGISNSGATFTINSGSWLSLHKIA